MTPKELASETIEGHSRPLKLGLSPGVNERQIFALFELESFLREETEILRLAMLQIDL